MVKLTRTPKTKESIKWDEILSDLENEETTNLSDDDFGDLNDDTPKPSKTNKQATA